LAISHRVFAEVYPHCPSCLGFWVSLCFSAQPSPRLTCVYVLRFGGELLCTFVFHPTLPWLSCLVPATRP
jgi:hypothetical protein